MNISSSSFLPLFKQLPVLNPPYLYFELGNIRTSHQSHILPIHCTERVSIPYNSDIILIRPLYPFRKIKDFSHYLPLF